MPESLMFRQEHAWTDSPAQRDGTSRTRYACHTTL